MQQLSIGTLLQGGKYRIEKVLGQGGFGITYLADQVLFERKVCIKEFFFKEYCERDEETSKISLGTQSSKELVERFLKKFLKEARTISRLEHPNIIRIFDIFTENNTAYYAMEYIDGESLAEKLKKEGPLPESIAIDYIKQVASALSLIHGQSINHLDIKPANIMVRSSDNRAVLIDFGLSKQYDSQGGQTSTTPVGISHGYAPMEQYNSGGVSTFSPQSDIYSLGATLYKLLTGITPPQATELINEGLSELPVNIQANVKNAITKAMQLRKVDRPANIEAFLALLNEDVKDLNEQCGNEETHIIASPEKIRKSPRKETVPEKVTKSSTQPPNAPKKNSKGGCCCFFIVIFVILLLIAGVFTYFILYKKTPPKTNNYQYNKRVSTAVVEKKEDVNFGVADTVEYYYSPVDSVYNDTIP